MKTKEIIKETKEPNPSKFRRAEDKSSWGTEREICWTPKEVEKWKRKNIKSLENDKSVETYTFFKTDVYTHSNLVSYMFKIGGKGE